ncbi:hypothetical protein F7725_003823 [Dissostichus mawsoni]|uniref:Uncharacterized protein n=1 Tax=Dissostichus mawsoni TaxID=36200 RepID=A0A7J5YBF0_DISMA|nr:hypothetical protein F7725_003823 [Dissostichus mawsoni]
MLPCVHGNKCSQLSGVVVRFVLEPAPCSLIGSAKIFHPLLIMSTTSHNFFGDRNEVPDLLKSLAEYPFCFADFVDTGSSQLTEDTLFTRVVTVANL